MTKESKIPINVNSKSYILSTIDCMGTKEFKYMIQAELLSDNKVTLFLLGIPNPTIAYANAADVSQQGMKNDIRQSAVDSIADFMKNDDWIEGKTYYGEYAVDQTFKISDKKPVWEDGNWGTRI